MKHIWGKSFFRCWHLCNVHAPALFCYFLRVHVQRFSERGDVLPCVQVLHSPGAVHAAVWQTALQESGGQWTGAGFVSHRVLSVKTWCFFGWGGGGGVFFLWLLLLMLSICFYDCYFGTTAWLNLCSNLFLIFLYFAFEVDITSWLNLVQIVILLLLYFVFFFFSLSPTALLS